MTLSPNVMQGHGKAHDRVRQKRTRALPRNVWRYRGRGTELAGLCIPRPRSVCSACHTRHISSWINRMVVQHHRVRCHLRRHGRALSNRELLRHRRRTYRRRRPAANHMASGQCSKWGRYTGRGQSGQTDLHGGCPQGWHRLESRRPGSGVDACVSGTSGEGYSEVRSNCTDEREEGPEAHLRLTGCQTEITV